LTGYLYQLFAFVAKEAGLTVEIKFFQRGAIGIARCFPIASPRRIMPAKKL